ncbi:class I SAM-dependent methyltransferase [Aliivibrio fischeri]|uniref:class I SAM-dependent methyltransferase n=1 Tax=Aliivibrio fischeri TaxID=668 RepID=UPI0007C516B5|nr:class I SAM-dependent methyltransferase [Aliivibrio fischeri]TGA68884.1 class I SAM-dependent methyltransferase [Aliivibrio fischeri]
MTNYYNENALTFFSGTVEVNVESLYKELLPYLPTHAKIIDAGCGSGRDTLYFLNKNYRVTAFDASEELITLAQQYTQHPILHSTFLDFNTRKASQDAIWACASLLHVPMNELEKTFHHLTHFLKQEGLFYCSFKYGDGEVERNGRSFTNLNETLLNDLLKKSQLSIKKTWITEDLRPNRANEKWLNAILIKLKTFE